MQRIFTYTKIKITSGKSNPMNMAQRIWTGTPDQYIPVKLQYQIIVLIPMNRRILIQNLFAVGSNSTCVENFSQPDSIQLKVDLKGEDKSLKSVNESALAKTLNGEIVEIAFTQSSEQVIKPAGIIYQFQVTL